MPRNRAPAMALFLGHVKLPKRYSAQDTLILSTVWLSKVNRYNRLEREAAEAEAAAREAEEKATTPTPSFPANALVVYEPNILAALTKA